MKTISSWPWRLCCIGFFLLTGLVFSPWILAPGRIEPSLMGLPFTLWTSILIGFALLGLTVVGSRIRSTDQAAEPDSP